MNSDRQDFTADDIRFTTHDGMLYAIALRWPGSGELRVHTLFRATPYLQGPVCGVQLLGSESQLSFTQDEYGLHVKLPDKRPHEPVFAFRIMESHGPSITCAR